MEEEGAKLEICTGTKSVVCWTCRTISWFAGVRLVPGSRRASSCINRPRVHSLLNGGRHVPRPRHWCGESWNG